ncbi:MAG: adenylyltransferase/cytidyltransferase family protein [Bacteroidales bacterium]|nr:adenylyltransferase/cytidyltransferase family protein [Bacteroidales bacterium]
MKKVITYGTFDLFHYGHRRLLERAKKLGDYLIVGVTAEDFDKARGKINVQQTLMERIEALKATGLADEIIIEEYEGQKIDDILRYGVDIFAIGSDWVGKFDYLKQYCEVVYLERTEGVSSSELRAENSEMRLGIVGDELPFLSKFERESRYVNGLSISGFCYLRKHDSFPENLSLLPVVTDDFKKVVEVSDAVFLNSTPQQHYQQIKYALLHGCHVLCEPPISMRCEEWDELVKLAADKGLVLMDALRTAYAMAYRRLLLLAKSGVIGRIFSVDSSITVQRDTELKGDELLNVRNSISTWGANSLLPVFQLLGTDYVSKRIITHIDNEELKYDTFTKIDFVYKDAVASIKVGKGVKTEGDLVISGTTGYIYVPAPWWKTEYFEVRREDPANNKRYFYQLDGEGIRYELVSFVRSVQTGRSYPYINNAVSKAMVGIIEDFYSEKDLVRI